MDRKPCSSCLHDIELVHQIEELKGLLIQLEIKHHALWSHMNANHDPFIHKLLLELTSYIFVLTLLTHASELKSIGSRDAREANSVALSLSAVCCKWCQIAWSTPRLWSTLSIYIPGYQERIFVTSLSKFTSNWLGQSGQISLDIHFSYELSSYQEVGNSDIYTTINIINQYSR